MNIRRRSSLLIGFFITLQTLWMTACSSAKYETPDYCVVSVDGAVEIRDYPSLTVVSASMPHRGSDGTFMKLFRFISGKNERTEKIAMTTPVLMTGADSGSMSFILPKDVATKGTPLPSSPDLSLTVKPATRYAVLRFSGSGSPEQSLRQAAKLEAWLKAKGITSTGGTLFAYYNPPWTPWFLRRNEVLIPIPHPVKG